MSRRSRIDIDLDCRRLYVLYNIKTLCCALMIMHCTRLRPPAPLQLPPSEPAWPPLQLPVRPARLGLQATADVIQLVIEVIDFQFSIAWGRLDLPPTSLAKKADYEFSLVDWRHMMILT